MKTLVVYATRYGFTGKIANDIYTNIKGEKRLVKFGIDVMPDLDNFDSILVGCAVYAGKINSKLFKFMEKNRQLLASKKVILFYAAAEKITDPLKIFPSGIGEYTVGIYRIGFEITMKKLGFFIGTIFRIMGRSKDYTEKDEGNITKIIQQVNGEAQ